jgi:hypothetical protein
MFHTILGRDNLSGMGEGGGGFYLRLYYDDSTVVFNNNILAKKNRHAEACRFLKIQPGT